MGSPSGLLEREEELAAIAGLLDAAAAGDGGLLTIEGEAGAGKTALLEAAAGIGEEREMLVLRARGGEYERDFPYGVVRQLFERLLGEDGRREELLGGSAALAAPVFEPAAAPREGADPFAAEHGLYWLVADLAASRPLLLLVDDAQWADPASLSALAYVARRLDGLAAALVAGVRIGDPAEPGELDRIRREPCAHLLEPPPLSPPAVAALVAAETGRDPGERLALACLEATAGNPFLLTELSRALEVEGAELIEVDPASLSGLAAAGVAKWLLARLEGLGESSAEVARAVAVLEPNAEVRLVAALAGLPVEAVARAAESLIEARLVADARPLAFVHPLVRAAVLADMSTPRRAAVHGQAARLLRENGAAADAVAAHLLLAEPAANEWAVGELRAAAELAVARGAAGAGVRYLRRALREPPPPGQRLAVSRELGSALLKADDPEGIDVLRAVRSSLDDPVARAEIVTEISLSLTIRRRSEEANELLGESLAEQPDPDGELATLLRGHLLIQVLWGGERRPDQALLRPAEELDETVQADRVCLNAMTVLDALGMAPLDRALALAERLAANPAALEADALAGLNSQGVMTALVLNDQGDRAAAAFAITGPATLRRGAVPGIAGEYGNQAYCHYVDGLLREGQADAEIAVQMIAELDIAVPISTWIGALLSCLTARGELAAAEAALDEVWAGREIVPGFPGALFLCARGALRQTAGRVAEARHDYLAAAERIRWLPYANPEVLGWRTGLASCEAALGNEAEARRLAAEAVELARRATGPRGLGVALRVLGEVSGGEEGLAALREAVALLAPTRARLRHAEALASYGAALRRANRRKEARAPLREALELAHLCGAAPLEELARAELAATGARPRSAVLSGVESLTPSELRVARLAAGGMTNREVAGQLFVTAKTVETHLRHVYGKLGIAGRDELAGELTS